MGNGENQSAEAATTDEPRNVLEKVIERYGANPSLLAVDDERRVELTGVLPEFMADEPLLNPLDRACLVINEKECILVTRFAPHALAKDSQEYFEQVRRAACVLTANLHFDLLRDAQLVPPELKEDEVSLDAIWRVLLGYRMWRQRICDPSTEDLRLRGHQDPEYFKALGGRRACPLNRWDRIAQLNMLSVYAHEVFEPAADTVRAMEKAFKMHEWYKPDALRDGKYILQGNKLQAVGSLALTLEQLRGFDKLVSFRPDGKMGMGWTQAKDGLDDLNSRTAEYQQEPPVLSLDAPIYAERENGRGRHFDPEAAASDEATLAHVEVAATRARAAAEGLGQLLDEAFAALTVLAGRDESATLDFAAKITKLVGLIAAQPDAATKAGIFYAWARGAAFRSPITAERVAEAFGVASKTVHRRAVDGAELLAAAGFARGSVD